MKNSFKKIVSFSVAWFLVLGLVMPVLNLPSQAVASRVLMFDAANPTGRANMAESYEVTYGTAEYNGNQGKAMQLKLTSSGETLKNDWNKMNGVAAIFTHENETNETIDAAAYPKGVLRIWLKSPIAMKFTVALQENAAPWDFYLYQAEITSEQAGKFVNIDIPINLFKKSKNSIYTDETTDEITSGKIHKIFVTCLRNNTQWISAGQTLEFGSTEFWDGQPPEPVTDPVPEPEAAMVDSVEAVAGVYAAKTSTEYDVVYQEQVEYDGSKERTAAVYTLTSAGAMITNPRMEIYIRTQAAGWKNWYVAEYPTGYLRLWIKADKALDLGITIQESSSVNASANYSVSVSEDDTGKFVPIDIPLSEFQAIAVSENSRINKIWIDPKAGDLKLETGETVMLGRLEYWSAQPPKTNPEPDPNPDPPEPKPPVESKLLYANKADHTDMWSDIWSGNDTPMEMVIEALSENDSLYPLYTAAAKYTLKPEMAEQYLNSGPDFKYIRIGRISGTDAANLKDYTKSGTLRLRLAATEDITFSVGLLDMAYNAAYVSKSLKAGSGYTVIDIPLSEFAETSADLSSLREVRLRPVTGTTATTSEFLSGGNSLYVLGMEFWTGEAKDRKGDEPAPIPDDEFTVNKDTVGSKKLFETDFINTTAWSDDFNDNKGDRRTVLLETANLDSGDPYFKYFHTVLNVSLNPGREKAYYEKNYPIYFFGSTVYDTIKYERIPIDISSALTTGTLRFYISVPRDMTINIGVTDSKWNSVMVARTIKKSDGLTEVCIPLSELAAYAKNVDFSRIVQIRMKPVDGANAANGLFLKPGEKIVLGPLQIWSKGAANIELPGAFDNLPSQSSEATKKIFETEYLKKNCWSDDWNSGGERSIKVDTVMLDSEDVNYYKFKRAAAVSLNPDLISKYYESRYPVAFFGQSSNTDLLPYIMKGTVRFWVKSSRTMTVDMALVDDEYRVVKVPVNVTESEEYTEVKIPLKDFYYTAWEQGIVFNWNAFSHIRMYPSAAANSKNGLFLLAGDAITFGYMQLWTGEAPEPSAEEIDITRIFYDFTSGAYIKDYDLSLLEGTELRYFEITSESELEDLRGLIGNKRELISAFGLYVITNGAKNDSALGKVDIFLPICDALRSENAKFAVLNDKYEIIAVNTRIEGDYLVVSTSDFGRLLVYTGEAYTEKLQSVLSFDSQNPEKPSEEGAGISYTVIVAVIAASAVILIGGVTAAVIIKKKSKKAI